MSPDPFDRLASAAEAVARRAQTTTSRVAYERANRLGLLWIHAIVATLAGLQMILYGTATQIEHLVGPGARLVMGPLAFTGGVLLTYGLTRRPRSIPLEAAGLTLIALWDLAMTVGLGYARLAQHTFDPVPLNRPLPEGYVSAYPVCVYAGLLALLVVHLWTLRLMRRHPSELGDNR